MNKIVLVSWKDGIEDIYVINPDGSNEKRLTYTTGEKRGSWIPRWSPDRRKIVFASNRDDGGYADIYVMDSDGSNIQRLTNNKVYDYAPAFSPDGKKIAFNSTKDGKTGAILKNLGLYVMNADGSNVQRLEFVGGHLDW